VKVLNFDEAKGVHPPGIIGSMGLSPADAQARAEAIRKELMAGADFSKLTEEYKPPEVTIDHEPRKVRRGGMRPDLEKVAFALKDGEVSDPVDINAGLILFQVIGHSRVDLKDASSDIERKLRQTRADAAVAEVKKDNSVWMDDQYFAVPNKPQEGPMPGPARVNIPPRP
jgi:foldase protein PrsA